VRAYGFSEAQKRIERLKRIYRIMKATHPQDGTWDWWIKTEITELKREMATTANSDHWATRFRKAISLSVSRLLVSGKEGSTL